jgi:serine/threonine protein kinase
MSSPTPKDFVSSSSLSAHTLPEGTRLRDFEINGLIGEGGFGIVYLAYDHSLGRRVAIKEYMPASMASRAQASSAVVVKSQRHEETFRLGLKSFVNEARLLARFDHPALVKVYRFWEENGTAYMVMPYYQGPTLKHTLAELGRMPTEAELRGWLGPLLDALAVMHEARCFHRDIAPDNILLTSSGPLLLDFGAARHVIGDMTHALTVVLKPGFAPIEQYGEVPTLTQGAWTDLYALASVVYAAVTGKAPISAVERLMDDRHVPLAQFVEHRRLEGQFSESFVLAIDAALHLRPRDRPQDVAAFRLLFDGQAVADSGRSPLDFVSSFGGLLEPSNETTQPPTHPDPPKHHWTVPDEVPRAQPSIIEKIAPSAKPAPAAGAAHLPQRPSAAARERAAIDAPTPQSDAPSRHGPLIALALLAGVAALAAGGWYLTRAERNDAALGPAPSPAATVTPVSPAPPPVAAATKPPEPSPAPAPTVVSPPVPAPAPAPAPDATAAPAPPPAADPEPAPAPTALPAAPSPAPVAAAKPKREPRVVPAEPAAHPAPPERATPTNAAATRAKCSDILQKASLEPLTASEAAYLRRECQ